MWFFPSIRFANNRKVDKYLSVYFSYFFISREIKCRFSGNFLFFNFFQIFQKFQNYSIVVFLLYFMTYTRFLTPTRFFKVANTVYLKFNHANVELWALNSSLIQFPFRNIFWKKCAKWLDWPLGSLY